MPRPVKTRFIRDIPRVSHFKPRGKPMRFLEEIILTLDEYEALRLADLEGKNHNEASKFMGISRPTFTRLIERARRKLADGIINGKLITIEGGNYKMASMRRFRCYTCNHVWELPHGTGRPSSCPSCGSNAIHRAEEDRGHSRGGGTGRGPGGSDSRR
ncbi:MAG TPA: DUF134 domain-containing protein [Nitrospinota bacterium]|nr:DUF134 domain-containing protein [Nitrospinota bacterium]